MTRVRLALVALALAMAGGAAIHRAAPHWTPVCALYSPEDFEYWLLGCWVDPPPKDPSA